MFLEFARYIKSSGKLVSGDICEWSCPFCTLPALSTDSQSALWSLVYVGISKMVSAFVSYICTLYQVSSALKYRDVYLYHDDFKGDKLLIMKMKYLSTQTLSADRTNARAYATMLRPSFCYVCIVAKRCVLEQKLLLTA